MKTPQDPYGKRLKTLISQVQRLRGWTGSDPSRRAELVDAMVALNAHRLLGHRYRAAAADTQEGLRSAVELMLSDGPVGPYTRLENADRCARSMIQLARVQLGLGLPEPAGRSLEAWNQLRGQIANVGLRPTLDPPTLCWVLGVAARVALSTGSLGRANAHADAALTRWAESGLATDGDPSEYGLLGIDVDRLASDCRWAAGLPADAIGFIHRARASYDALTDGRLAQPGRYPPALIERLAEPLFGLYRDLADRLSATGETELALVTRRALIETLRGLVARVDPVAVPVKSQLVDALSDLADDLRNADRLAEAQQCADEAVSLAEDPVCTATTRLLADASRARIFVVTGRAEDVIDSLSAAVSAEGDASPAASAVALWALADAVRAGGDPEAAAAMERQAADLSASHGGILRAALIAARNVVGLGARPVGWTPLDDEAGYGPVDVVAAPSPVDAAEQAEAQRLEAERRAEAEQAAEARRQADAESARVAAEQEAARRAAEQRAADLAAEEKAAAEAAEQAERKRRREERLAEHQREVELREAAERGDRREKIETRMGELRAGVVGAAEERELERLRFELAELDGQPTELVETSARDEASNGDQAPEPALLEPAPASVEASQSRSGGQPVSDADQEAEPGPIAEPDNEGQAVPTPESDAGGEPDAGQPVLSPTEAQRELGAEVREPSASESGQRQESPPAPQPVPDSSFEGETGSEIAPEPATSQEPDEVERARASWQQARAAGDRRAARAALEALVELLRPRAQTDLATWGPQLRSALEDLASARLRGGDLFGSRSASREAKNLGKSLG